MTETLRVDTAAIHALADRIRRAAAQARAASAGPGSLHAGVVALGPACLVRATGAFLEGWRGALGDLVDDANRLADLVDLVARSYQDVESANARRVHQ